MLSATDPLLSHEHGYKLSGFILEKRLYLAKFGIPRGWGKFLFAEGSTVERNSHRREWQCAINGGYSVSEEEEVNGEE
jgi:hypothetical protein